MTAQTPIYGLKYLALGEPARNTRQALQDNAFTIEAALQAGGVAAPGASDLLAVSGRVSVVEGKVAVPVAVRPALTASFTPYAIAPFTEGAGLMVTKDPTASRVYVEGLLKPAAALTTAATTVCTLPVGSRPPAGTTVIRRAQVGGTSGAQPAFPQVRVVGDTGVVEILLTAALAAGNTTIQFDFSFRTVTT